MIWHDIEQNSDDWFNLRLGKITSSNYDTIMANLSGAFGETATKYALQIALERITGIKAEHSFSNKHTERGHKQEPIARELYEQKNFIDVTNGGFFDCGYYGDSPDGLVDTDGVIEIKCVTDAIHYATLVRGNYDPSYKWQIVGHLDCSGRDWCDFISYCSDFPIEKQLLVYRITKDDVKKEIELLQNRREQFNKFIEQIAQKIMKI